MAQKAVKERPMNAKQEEVNHENLEVAAYYHWLNRGCPAHDDLTDWVEVEQEFKVHSK